jgi:hypothetical protein
MLVIMVPVILVQFLLFYPLQEMGFGFLPRLLILLVVAACLGFLARPFVLEKVAEPPSILGDNAYRTSRAVR